MSVGGNYYSVPDATRRRVVEVHSMADEIRIFEGDQLIASHPVLDKRWQRSLIEGHRLPTRRKGLAPVPPVFTGDLVALRPLDIYEAVGRRLAAGGTA